MRDIAWNNWVPLGAALIAALAVLVSADLLTVTSRLRRRLDKDLTILARLTPGVAHRDLERVCRSNALTLSFISEREMRVRRTAMITAIGYVAMTIASFIVSSVWNLWDPMLIGVVLGTALAGMLWTWLVLWWFGRHRRRYVRKWLNQPTEMVVRRPRRLTPRVITAGKSAGRYR